MKWLDRQISWPEEMCPMQSARCSECGKWLTTPYLYWFEEFRYCPNCGEEMNNDE